MENQIVKLEFDVRSGKMDSKRDEGIIKKFQNELDIKQQEKNEIEKEIDDVGKDRNWLNWVEKFGDTIKLNTADETKQKEFLKGILDKVIVNSEYDQKDKQQGHSFDFLFKMKIYDIKISIFFFKSKGVYICYFRIKILIFLCKMKIHDIKISIFC